MQPKNEEEPLVINRSEPDHDAAKGTPQVYGTAPSPPVSPRRLLARIQQAIRWRATSILQAAGNTEMLVSRFSSTKSRAVVSDVSDVKFRPVGAPLTASERQVYGQWITTSNPTYDALDYEDIESIACHEAKAKRRGKLEPPRWKMWLIIGLIGIVTGLVAFFIDESIKFLFHMKFSASERYMKTPSQDYFSNSTNPKADEATVPFFWPWCVFMFINLAMVSIAAVLVIWGEPVAKGSGIGEIKCYLNGIRLFRVVRIKTLLCKAIGILFSVASGLPCGKEGPMIHSGAAIAGGISTGKSSKLHFDTGLFKEFRSDRIKRHFVTAGAAAGVGVAFGAPIGGLLFAVEEVGSFWNPELTVLVFGCSAIAPWTLQRLNDPTSPYGAVRGLMSFGVVSGSYHYWDLPFLILLGALGGLLGALFVVVNLQLARWRQKYCETRWRRFIEVLCVSALVSTTLMILVTFGFQCHPVTGSETEVLAGNLKNYGCHKDEYNDMATYWFRSMEDTIHIMTHSESEIQITTLLMRFIPYFLITCLTYGIHVPSGLFLPSLALGVNFGHLYAQFWNSILPSSVHLDPSSYALFGATAILGGIVRMTISIIVIIMEATSNTTFFYPLVVVTALAKIVGDLFSHGIYDEHIELAHIPLLETRLPRPEMNLMCAGDLMNTDIVLLHEQITVSDLIKVLKARPLDNSLIVVNREKRLRGVLLRRQALVLIDKQAWERPIQFEEFTKSAKEREFLKLKKYKFFEKVPQEADDKIIDLGRYIDQWPFRYHPTAPVSRIYRLFRELGLRHIVVVDEQRVPIGIIGRKQLCFLEMADPNALRMDKTPPRHAVDVESGEQLPQVGSWRNIDEWSDAYRKHIN